MTVREIRSAVTDSSRALDSLRPFDYDKTDRHLIVQATALLDEARALLYKVEKQDIAR